LFETIETAGALSTAFTSTLVIVSGALYILLFTISRLRNKPGLLTLAYACFAVQVANVLVLIAMLHFDAYGVTQAIATLLAYLLVPHAILHIITGAADRPENLSDISTISPDKQ